MAQSVEHVLGKDEVTSSSLVSSSKNARYVRAFFLCFASFKIGEKILTIFMVYWLHGFHSFGSPRSNSLFKSVRNGLKLPKRPFGLHWLHLATRKSGQFSVPEIALDRILFKTLLSVLFLFLLLMFALQTHIALWRRVSARKMFWSSQAVVPRDICCRTSFRYLPSYGFLVKVSR